MNRLRTAKKKINLSNPPVVTIVPSDQIAILAFNTKQVAKSLNVSRVTVMRLIKAKKLRCVSGVGRRKLISASELQRFANQ